MFFNNSFSAKPKRSKTKSDLSSSTSSRLSTVEVASIVEQLKLQQHRESTRENYYTVWRLFNKFFLRLDLKPRAWEDQLTLFVAHLIDCRKQPSTVKSYISAIKAVLKMHNIHTEEDQYLLSSLTQACRLKNDQLSARLLIQKDMLANLLKKAQEHFLTKGQPYLATLYCAIFLSMYHRMFRVSKIATGSHPILAKDVHIGCNKNKILFILRSSKTHDKSNMPQIVKISSTLMRKSKRIESNDNKIRLPCPFTLLREYRTMGGGICRCLRKKFCVQGQNRSYTPTNSEMFETGDKRCRF